MSSDLFTPERIRQLRMMGDIKYPMEFSPVSTSSPLSVRVRTPRREISFISYHSASSDSSGNITERAIQGIEDSIIIDQDNSKMIPNESDVSVHTALEYIDSFIFETHIKMESVSRTEIYEALKICAIRDFEESPEKAQLFALIASERILWDDNRTWHGSLSIGNKQRYLDNLKQSGFDDYYLRKAVGFCVNEFSLVSSSSDNFDRGNMFTYFQEKGCPAHILNQVFENSSVRNSHEESLSMQEMIHFIFAFYGPDDAQSFEYWFRVIGTTDRGTLCFRQLQVCYDQVLEFLKSFSVDGLPFASVIEQFCDMMGTDKWNLAVFKKNSSVSYRVLNAFTNAREFFSDETDERMNRNRVDDEQFGLERSIWKRMLDHMYDSFYADSSSSFDETGVRDVAALE